MEAGRPFNRVLRRLSAHLLVPEEVSNLLGNLPVTVKNVPPNQCIVREGDAPTHVSVVLDGYLYRHKMVNGSQRQIMSFLVPGDMPDLQCLFLKKLDHSLSALGPAVVGFVPLAAVRDAAQDSVALNQVFWHQTLIDAAIFQEWVINLGQRDALTRVSHVLCELHLRLKVVGLAREDRFSIPWIQADLADACGISTVHANRVVQELRRLGVVEWDTKRIRIVNGAELAKLGDFRADYLHYVERQAEFVS
jgi:CRP-like cAMP-binding protein